MSERQGRDNTALSPRRVPPAHSSPGMLRSGWGLSGSPRGLAHPVLLLLLLQTHPYPLAALPEFTLTSFFKILSVPCDFKCPTTSTGTHRVTAASRLRCLPCPPSPPNPLSLHFWGPPTSRAWLIPTRNDRASFTPYLRRCFPPPPGSSQDVFLVLPYCKTHIQQNFPPQVDK